MTFDLSEHNLDRYVCLSLEKRPLLSVIPIFDVEKKAILSFIVDNTAYCIENVKQFGKMM